jgi:hypothetical protein
MPGRDVLAVAIRAFEDRAAFGVSCSDAYGVDAISAGLRRNIELDGAVATFLTALKARGEQRLEDMPKGKDGEPSFVSKMRFETTRDIVQLIVGALRGAFVKFPVETAPAVTEEPQNAA